MERDNQSPLINKSANIDRADAPVRAARYKGQRLHDVAEGKKLFTTALMLQGGEFDRDPVAECCAMHNLFDVVEVWDIMSGPLFNGLGWCELASGGVKERIDWDRRIYMVPDEHWDTVRRTILGMAWMHPEFGVIRTVHHEIQIIDPVALREKGAVPCVLTATVFCPMSQKIDKLWFLGIPNNISDQLPRPMIGQVGKIEEEPIEWQDVPTEGEDTSEDSSRHASGPDGEESQVRREEGPPDDNP